eukprot:3868798-Rhodomonas_salina.3
MRIANAGRQLKPDPRTLRTWGTGYLQEIFRLPRLLCTNLVQMSACEPSVCDDQASVTLHALSPVRAMQDFDSVTSIP